MKIVINRKFGGFGLSPLAVKKLAELQGRPCYFFKHGRGADGNLLFSGEYYAPSEIEELDGEILFYAFDIPNPGQVLKHSQEEWGLASIEERKRWNMEHSLHVISDCDIDRSDSNLVKVVEYLGDKANTRYSKLEIVEIPDGVDWTIEENDGMEWVAEKHRTWD